MTVATHERHLRQILRSVLFASMATPLVLGSMACGGRVNPVGAADSGAPSPQPLPTPEPYPSPSPAPAPTPTPSPPPPPPPSCQPQACGGDCAANCTLEGACVGNQWQCTCVCTEPIDASFPPPIDAGFPEDVEMPDTSFPDVGVLDSGACQPPNPIQICQEYALPLKCFPGLPPSGILPPQECVILCGSQGSSSCFVDTSATPAVLECNLCVNGRRPAGMKRARVARRASALGRHFAQAAHLEAAAVDAFRILREELRAHGAPAELIDAASRAERDEVRHARMTAALARRHGTPVRARKPAPRKGRSASPAARSLETIAIENMIEGCVRETFGALAAEAQAMLAADGEVRAVMARIAPDETRHAALGWAVATWAEGKLDEGARARVAEARRAAVAELLHEADVEPSGELRTVAGIPSARTARELLERLDRALWADAA